MLGIDGKPGYTVRRPPGVPAEIWFAWPLDWIDHRSHFQLVPQCVVEFAGGLG